MQVLKTNTAASNVYIISLSEHERFILKTCFKYLWINWSSSNRVWRKIFKYWRPSSRELSDTIKTCQALIHKLAIDLGVSGDTF
jgi:hypothetical protein